MIEWGVGGKARKYTVKLSVEAMDSEWSSSSSADECKGKEDSVIEVTLEM